MSFLGESRANALKNQDESADPRTLMDDFRGLVKLHDNTIRCRNLLETEGVPADVSRQLEDKLEDTLTILYDLLTNTAWQLVDRGTEHPDTPKYCAEALLFLGEDDPTNLCSVLTMRICKHLAHGDMTERTTIRSRLDPSS